MTAEVCGDAQVALGKIHRNGFGKTRHIQTGVLWIQQVSAEKRQKFGKAFGKLNPADLVIKYLDHATIEQHVAKLNYIVEEGKASEAPKFHNVSISIDECELLGQGGEWEWLQLIKNSIQHDDNKKRKQEKQRWCRGEINLCERGIRSTDWVTENRNSSQSDLGQSVLRGFRRRVKGSNGSDMHHVCMLAAQLSRPRGSTKTFPSRHNEAQ